MRLQRACWGLLMAVLASSCDSGDPEYSVTLTLTPEKPIVFNTAFERKTGEKDADGNPITETVTPDWFYATYAITNKGSSTITIASITVTIQLPPPVDSSTGETTEGTCEIAPDATEGNDKTYLAEIASGATGSVTWICYGLNFPEGAGFATSGTIQLNGWIGTSTTPVDRLNTKLFTFSTK